MSDIPQFLKDYINKKTAEELDMLLNGSKVARHFGLNENFNDYEKNKITELHCAFYNKTEHEV